MPGEPHRRTDPMIKRIRHLLTALWHRLTSPTYRRLEKSGLFDPDYYLKKYPDVAASGADPLTHYLRRGSAELRQPGPLFDGIYYLHQVPSVDEQRENPLLHFLEIGRYSGIRPNPLIDPEYYARTHPEFASSCPDPLSHFLGQHEKPGQPHSPSPYFDPVFYCNQYTDAAGHAGDSRAAYRHFLAVGLAEGRRPSVYFDTAWYLDKSPILRELGLDPIRHYFMFGCREQKSPSPLFDPVFYAKTYGIETCADLFGHYLRHSRQDDRQPCSWFDPRFYRETYLDGLDDPPAPLQHFLETGLAGRLYPNREVQELPEKPILSVVVPVYNVDPADLNTCIRSVLYQSYPHWELCLADDCSTDSRIRPLLSQWQAADSRIKVTRLAENSGISAATNAAARLAGGSWLAFLDNDDELRPDALQIVAARINHAPGDLYYSDEDLIGADGRRFSVFRKPGFNGELLLCHNYVTHWVVTKKALYDRVGGCASAFDGAQDLDLFLKLAEQAKNILHIPQVLYHWRASATSTSIAHGQKTYADQAGRAAVAAALARRGESAEVLFTDLKFYYRAKRKVGSGISVTVIVYCNHEEKDFVPWLTALLAAPDFTIGQLLLLVANPALGEVAVALGRSHGIDSTCHFTPDSLGPARAFDAALNRSTGDLVAFVNTPAMVGAGWLAALVEYGQLPEIGMVGGRIDYPAGHPDLVTPIPDCRIATPGYYARFLSDCSTLMNGRHCPQEVLFVKGELCLAKTAELRAEGGLNCTDFPHLFAFHDLSCRLRGLGRKNIYTPYCRAAITAGGGLRMGAAAAELHREHLRFRAKWLDLLLQGDPFYNTGILADGGHSVAEYQTWLTGNSTSQPQPEGLPDDEPR